MRYAIVSDIHSNLQAWNAVLADLTALKVKKIICLGDVIGYGPQPAEVLQSVYRHVDHFVMGNHDAVVAGKMSDEAFNDNAQTMIRWTASQLTDKAKAFLAEQPLVLRSKKFICVHGSLDRPQAFNYILSPQEALDTWSATNRQIIFIGHAHIPAIFVMGESGTPHLIPSQDFYLEEGKRYIVNVGSVGDPRDADTRASYCIFDDANGLVTFRRVAFDYEALRAAGEKIHLKNGEIPILRRDPLPHREAVRETLGFAPPSNDSGMAQNVVSSGYIGTLRKINSRLRIGISAAIIAFMAATGVATALIVNSPKGMQTYPETPLEKHQIIVPSDLIGNLLTDFPTGPVNGKTKIVTGWRYTLENPDEQSVELKPDPVTGRNTLTVTNTRRHKFILEAPDWELNGLAKGRPQIYIKAIPGEKFTGKVTLSVIANRGIADEAELMVLPLKIDKRGEWNETKRLMDKKSKFRINDKTQFLSYKIEAEFYGSFSLSEPALSIKND